MKNYFSEPELNISYFTVEDVIATSDLNTDEDETPVVPKFGG